MKTLGFNSIRIHSGSALPRQLDLLDDLGILVVEENFGAGWAKESSRIGIDWERSVKRVMKRDRNHPSIVIWSLLNERRDNILLRHAVSSTTSLREIDQTRILLLNSGRHDKDGTVGNICNPFETEWSGNLRDVHAYPLFPHTAKIIKDMISPISDIDKMGIENSQSVSGEHCPIFLTEYGVCGAEDLPHIVKRFEMIGKSDADDAKLYQKKYKDFLVEWDRLDLGTCWASPENYFKESHLNMALLLSDDFNAWAANPAIVGSFSSTQIVDAWFHGCGATTPFRKLKPGVADAYTNMFSPLRFSLFADPVNIYGGQEINFEAHLINVDVLKTGKHKILFKIISPDLICIMNEQIEINIEKNESPFAMKIYSKKLSNLTCEGKYRFTAEFIYGVEAEGGETFFYVTKKMPDINKNIILCGDDDGLVDWLGKYKATVRRLGEAKSGENYVIIVSGNLPANSDKEKIFFELKQLIANGSAAVFLTPETLVEKPDEYNQSKQLIWAPFEKEALPDLGFTQTWYFRCDHWAKKHAIFSGLPSGGILDYKLFRNILTGKTVKNLKGKFEAVGGTLQMSGAGSAFFESDTMLTVHEYGKGRFILNTMLIRENLGADPVADRLLFNMIEYASDSIKK